MTGPDLPDPDDDRDLEAAVDAVFSLENDDWPLDPEEEFVPWWARRLGPEDRDAIARNRVEREAQQPDQNREEEP
jgi:hypothetical protein